MIKTLIYNYNNYIGGADIFTKILKEVMERYYKVEFYYNDINKVEGDIDIIHNHNAFIGVSSHILTIHGMDVNRHLDFFYKTIEKSIITTCVSNYQKDYLEDSFKVNIDKVIYNFSDTYYYPKKNIPKEDIVVLFNSRFTMDKGIQYLLKFAYENPDITLMLATDVGDNNTNEELALFKKMIHLRNVKYVGMIKDREKYSEVLDLADFVLLPTKEDTCPISAIDALLKGVPVITSDIESLEEFSSALIMVDFEKDDIRDIIENTPYSKIKEKIKSAHKLFSPKKNSLKYFEEYMKFVM